MEGLTQTHTGEAANDSNIESTEMRETIEKAQELHSKLKEFDNTDVNGSASFLEVQTTALELTTILQTIPLKVRQQEDLPWHPHDAANDESYALAA